MNENTATTKPTAPSKPINTERVPIRIEKLIITHSNPHGVNIPEGHRGEGQKQDHQVVAGEFTGHSCLIEHLPWMRVFRITKKRRVTKTGPDGGKEIETWEPMGKPFHMPDTWAVSIPADES